MDVLSMFNVDSSTELAWVALGLLAQVCFGMRFIIQWISSENAKRSVIPLSFWYFSLVGGTMMLAYAIYRWDPVFILGQGMGLAVYVRNLVLIHRQSGVATAQSDNS
jgi:lipid-A-disaccharide synthase-like uncharacterized protein